MIVTILREVVIEETMLASMTIGLYFSNNNTQPDILRGTALLLAWITALGLAALLLLTRVTALGLATLLLARIAALGLATLLLTTTISATHCLYSMREKIAAKCLARSLFSE